MSSKSGLFRGHASTSGLFRHHIYKVMFVKKSCIEGQDCLEVLSTRSALSRGHVFKALNV